MFNPSNRQLFTPLVFLMATTSLVLGGDTPVVTSLKSRVAIRENRASLLRDELRATDFRIEDRIEEMINALQPVADSKNSRTKVVRMKERTIEELRQCIDDCQRRRAALQEELRRPTLNLTEDQKRRGVRAFDAHIEKRISQIIALYDSLPKHKDYARYKEVPGGWYGTMYVENQDWKQNQATVSHTNAIRARITDGLRASIAKVEWQMRDIQTQLASAKNDFQRNVLMEEISTEDALLLKRREQLAAVSESTEAPSMNISLKQAMTLDKALDEAIAGLHTETDTLFRYYSEYINTLVSLNAAKSQLTAELAKSAPPISKPPNP